VTAPNTIVVGPGAVGGFLAARLTQAGWPVCVLARGDTADALVASPMVIEEDGAEDSVKLRVTENPLRDGPFDLVLVCVKSMDTASAVARLTGGLSPSAIVLSIQNGVENPARISTVISDADVSGVAIYVGVERVAPLRIIRRPSRSPSGEARDRIVGGPAGRIGDALLAIGGAVGLRVDVTDDPTAALWSKLIGNVCLNTVTALGRSRVGAVFASHEARALMLALGHEVEAVASAAGISLPPNAAAVYIDDASNRLPPSGGTSTLFDLEAGRPLEHDALIGAVVRTGERTGVPTPVSRACRTLLNLIDEANQIARIG
jgi:2-dehydropantoate 2-reductase